MSTLRRFVSRRRDADPLLPDHLEDLRRSGLTDETIKAHRFRSLTRVELQSLLNFKVPTAVRSALLIPFPDLAGGFMEHVRVKVFPPLPGRHDNTIKYLQPTGSPPRLFFPLLTLKEALQENAPLYAVEGEKKSLAVAQLGLPAVGFCGIEGWHTKGSRDLIADFERLLLKDRIVELVPDGDCQTNDDVRRGAEHLALALAQRGARPRLVVLPSEDAR